MNLQVIKSTSGAPEFVLLPIFIYEKLSLKLQAELVAQDPDYVPFVLEDYIDNPVALARMKVHVTQEALATAMDVSQAYISKLEAQKKVSAKMLNKVHDALRQLIRK
ncbi:MAG: XRE family transcriptional regulator [Gammaproteobacteria bacterium]|nr:XRE family transcriptional regulator [Gammaproteobacteria bacterium]